MALTTVATNNRGIKFRNQVIREFVRGDMFSRYKSEDANSMFRVYIETGRSGGDQINLPFVTALQSMGVGAGPLTGNEEKISNSGFRAWIDWKRNAVVATKAEIKKGSFDLFAQGAPLLSEWGAKIQRDETVLGALAIPSESPPAGLGSDLGRTVNGILWSEATAAQRNAWLTDNNDRVWFGPGRATVAGNVASSMAAITTATGKANAALLRKMKASAVTTSPRIAPLTTDDGYERYVVFVGARGYRDLFADPEIYAMNKDSRPREGGTYKNNPLFNDGDLLYQGMVIRLVPEIDTLLMQYGAGNGGTPGTPGTADIAPLFLCGQNAFFWTWGQMIEETRLDDTDYQFLKGVGVEMAYGVGKLAARTSLGAAAGTTRMVDWGVMTGWVASPPDV